MSSVEKTSNSGVELAEQKKTTDPTLNVTQTYLISILILT